MMATNLGLSVTDSGAAVPEECVKQLFAEAYEGVSVPGAGCVRDKSCGYYAVRGIIEAHGGTFMTETSADGLKVVIMLP